MAFPPLSPLAIAAQQVATPQMLQPVPAAQFRVSALRRTLPRSAEPNSMKALELSGTPPTTLRLKGRPSATFLKSYGMRAAATEAPDWVPRAAAPASSTPSLLSRADLGYRQMAIATCLMFHSAQRATMD